jgi:short subunit dehydrogenase-like uncharacterized protein
MQMSRGIRVQTQKQVIRRSDKLSDILMMPHVLNSISHGYSREICFGLILKPFLEIPRWLLWQVVDNTIT